MKDKCLNINKLQFTPFINPFINFISFINYESFHSGEKKHKDKGN